MRTSLSHRIGRTLGSRRWFAAMGRRSAPLDRALYRATRGRVTLLGPQGVAMPRTLLLTTTGRRSGHPRTTPLMYLRERDSYVVTSESFGQPRPAAWPLNLAADPRCTVQVGRAVHACRARAATADEVDRLWPRFVDAWPAHAAYLERSGVRKMFFITPV